MLRRAAETGHADAALLEVALTANGSGGPPDFALALVRLRRAAAIDPLARDHLDLVEAMDIDADGIPRALPGWEPLLANPRVRRLPGLLSIGECRHLATEFDDLMRPSTIADPATGRPTTHPVRRSDAATIGPTRETLVVAAINRRIAAATRTTLEQGEPLTLLRYRAGQEFRSHVDALPGVTNQRTLTVIVYLNDDYVGGRTRFDATGRLVKPAAGDAIVFRNTTDDGRPDPESRHSGLPVLAGEKRVATRWIRAAALDPWKPA